MRPRTRRCLAVESLEARRHLAVSGGSVPAAPVGLAAAAVSASEVSLSWTLADAAESGVVIERRTGTDEAFATLAVLPAGAAMFTDTSCWAGTAYGYRVRARGPGGDSGFSPERWATSFAVSANAAATVNDLAVTATSATTTALVFTDRNPPGTSYLVERSSNGVAYEIVASIGGGTRWQDTALDPGATYWYRVRGTGWERPTSDYSGAVRVVMPARAASVPIEPAGVAAEALSATAVRVDWVPRDPVPSAYLVERSVGYDPWHPVEWVQVATTAVGATSFVDADLAREQPYLYRVRATRGGIESAPGRPAADVMHALFGDGVGVVTASSGSGTATTYDIGPGRQFARLGDLDWSRLGPGDTVNIHYQPGGYRELVQLSSRGTAAAWITINGVPDPVTGALPVIDGADAVLAPQFRNHWDGLHGFGGIVVGARPGFAAGYKPGFLTIRGLEVRHCEIGNSFTDVDGLRKPYGKVGAGIYLERCDHVTITGCMIHDNGEGIFGAGQSTFDRLMTDIVVDSNRIFGNGNVGSDREHNTYIEAVGTTYRFNRYGPLRAGALGAGLKDRSVGTVIVGNWIEGGLHQLQIPEAQNQADLAVALPAYRTTLVQGNTLVAPPGNGASPIWFGGDQGVAAWYRKGVLHVEHTTIVARSDQAQNFKITAIVAATGAEAIDVRNTIIAAIPDTSGARPADLGLVGGDNRATFACTWVTPGWLPTTLGDYTFTGMISGADRLLTGPAGDPGFFDLAAGDYRLAAGSVCIDAAGRSATAALPLTSQFRAPVGCQPRPVVGSGSDLGAFEAGGAEPLTPPAAPPPPPAPPPPSGPLVPPAAIRAVATSATRVRVEWQDRSGHATGFVVERRVVGAGWRVVGTVSAGTTKYIDKDVRPGRRYSYRVRAVVASGTTTLVSPDSDAVVVKTPRGVLGSARR